MAVVSVTDDPRPTPRQTGSHLRAVGFRAVCENIALKATERARDIGLQTGRQDLALRRLSNRARTLARAFHAWTLPPPQGRIDLTMRGEDVKAYDQLRADSKAFGIEPLGP